NFIAEPLMSVSEIETTAAPRRVEKSKSRGFWAEAWRRFRRRKLSMAALGYVLFLSLVALFSPAIVGVKPIVCKYKGSIYFPAMGYYFATWENPVFFKDRFRKIYPENLKKKDP